MGSKEGLFAACLAFVIVSNCAPPEPETVVQRNTSKANVELAQAFAAPVTPVLSVPTIGSATYNGVMAANVDGSYTGSLYADLSMTVDFAATSVTGKITNADLIDDFGVTVENMDGTLAITGGQSGGGIAASANGTLTGTNGPVVGAGVANFALLGTVRTNTTTADTVSGTVTGGVTGNYGLTLSNGEFSGSTH